MKVIVAGSRDMSGPTGMSLVTGAIAASGFRITELVSGGCRGADRLAEKWAQETNTPVKTFPADWKQYGRRAGPIRNRQMANYADALIALPRGVSRGTRSMIYEAAMRRLLLFVKELD